MLKLTTDLCATPEQCFDLSLSVDAHTSSMGASGERAVAGRTSGMLGPGETVTWRARHFGVPFRMTAQVVEHRRPHEFLDVQVSGPFASWQHRHRFEGIPGGGTTMTDDIEFRSPFGLLGRLVDRWVLGRYLERLITERNIWLKATLESTSSAC